MNVTSKVDEQALASINVNMLDALRKTADAIKTDVQQSQTMPFKTGEMQNRNTFIDDAGEEGISIVSDTPYARRMYFHPEYNFQKEKNPNAGGEWFEPYISGAKKDFPHQAFARFMKGKI